MASLREEDDSDISEYDIEDDNEDDDDDYDENDVDDEPTNGGVSDINDTNWLKLHMRQQALNRMENLQRMNGTVDTEKLAELQKECKELEQATANCKSTQPPDELLRAEIENLRTYIGIATAKGTPCSVEVARLEVAVVELQKLEEMFSYPLQGAGGDVYKALPDDDAMNQNEDEYDWPSGKTTDFTVINAVIQNTIVPDTELNDLKTDINERVSVLHEEEYNLLQYIGFSAVPFSVNDSMSRIVKLSAFKDHLLKIKNKCELAQTNLGVMISCVERYSSINVEVWEPTAATLTNSSIIKELMLQPGSHTADTDNHNIYLNIIEVAAAAMKEEEQFNCAMPTPTALARVLGLIFDNAPYTTDRHNVMCPISTTNRMDVFTVVKAIATDVSTCIINADGARRPFLLRASTYNRLDTTDLQQDFRNHLVKHHGHGAIKDLFKTTSTGKRPAAAVGNEDQAQPPAKKPVKPVPVGCPLDLWELSRLEKHTVGGYIIQAQELGSLALIDNPFDYDICWLVLQAAALNRKKNDLPGFMPAVEMYRKMMGKLFLGMPFTFKTGSTSNLIDTKEATAYLPNVKLVLLDLLDSCKESIVDQSTPWLLSKTSYEMSPHVLRITFIDTFVKNVISRYPTRAKLANEWSAIVKISKPRGVKIPTVGAAAHDN